MRWGLIGASNVAATQMIDAIRAGGGNNTWMDGFAEMPFGGIKESGQERELGRYGLEEFLEVKTVQMHVALGRSLWVHNG